jgi:regulator of sigma E protease
MVVVHEFGHFAVAKLCGVRVEAFSVGFGPRLFGIKYGETDYKVCLLPLGGYVKMTGETRSRISGSTPGTPVQQPGGERSWVGNSQDADPLIAGGRPRRLHLPSPLAAHADRRGRPGGQLHPGLRAHGLLLRLDQRSPKHEVKTTTIEWVVPARRRHRPVFSPATSSATLTPSTIPTGTQVNQRAGVEPEPDCAGYRGSRRQTVQFSLHVPPAAKGPGFRCQRYGLLFPSSCPAPSA